MAFQGSAHLDLSRLERVALVEPVCPNIVWEPLGCSVLPGCPSNAWPDHPTAVKHTYVLKVLRMQESTPTAPTVRKNSAPLVFQCSQIFPSLSALNWGVRSPKPTEGGPIVLILSRPRSFRLSTWYQGVDNSAALCRDSGRIPTCP